MSYEDEEFILLNPKNLTGVEALIMARENTKSKTTRKGFVSLAPDTQLSPNFLHRKLYTLCSS